MYCAVIFSLFFILINHTHASVREFTVGPRLMKSTPWNRFVQMDNTNGVWDTRPTQPTQRTAFELSASYSKTLSGARLLGTQLIFTLPQYQRSFGKPQGEPTVTKKSSFWGLRAGPTYKKTFGKNDSWFLDGFVGLGVLNVNQTISGGNETGNLSAAAWNFETRASIGKTVKVSKNNLLRVESGLYYNNTSPFMVYRSSGQIFSDLSSGNRLAVNYDGTQKTLKIRTAGIFINVGIVFDWFNTQHETDYETTPEEELTPASSLHEVGTDQNQSAH